MSAEPVQTETNPMRLMAQSFKLYLKALPALIGIACLSTLVVLISLVLLGQLALSRATITSGTDYDMMGYGAAIVLAISHAWFMIFACRYFGRRVARSALTPLPLCKWTGGIAILACLILAPVVAASIVWHGPLNTLPILGLMIVFSLTPILPKFALNAGDGLTQGITLNRLICAISVAIPYMIIAECLGWPSQICEGECWGIMEGGILMIPLLALHMFIATSASALVSSLIYLRASI